jgi:hypothetical protein
VLDIDPAWPWRQGSKNYRGKGAHRTLYVEVPGQDSLWHPMIGVMDTAELADLVVRTRQALAQLVRLHDGPRDETYLADREPAWTDARELLTEWVRLPTE